MRMTLLALLFPSLTARRPHISVFWNIYISLFKTNACRSRVLEHLARLYLFKRPCKQSWEKQSKSVNDKVMDRGIGRVLANNVKQTGPTCGFRAAYNMAITSSGKDALLSCKTLAEF